MTPLHPAVEGRALLERAAQRRHEALEVLLADLLAVLCAGGA